MKFRDCIYLGLGVLMAVWIVTIHRFEMNTSDMIDSVEAIGTTIIDRSGIRGATSSNTEEPLNSVQFFILVGRKNCEYTKVADGLLDRLVETYPNDVMQYKWNAKSKQEFDSWLSARKTTNQVPEYHTTSPVIFLRIGESRKFLGGVDQLLKYVEIRFPEFNVQKEIAQKNMIDDIKDTDLGASASLPKQRRKPSAGGNHEYSDDKSEDETILRKDGDALPEDPEPPIDRVVNNPNSLIDNQEQVPISVSPSQEVFMRSPYNQLQQQVPLRKKSIVSTYHITEKRVTNYRPMIDFLRVRGWSNMPQAPLLATWILVQDQKTAAYVLTRYHKSIVNNIGYGGQSCFGGTKGYQLRCRSEFATKFGCSYDDLHVQPPQYRLWEEPECRKFFDHVCVESPEAMWIEKPSGGQHGAGMRVHSGCEKLRESYSTCTGAGKKFIAMPYLSPALLSGHKFDVRSYLLIASLDPLLVFYHDGFARKAGSKYTSDTSDVNAHITNAESQTSEDHFYEFSRLGKVLHEESGFPADYMQRVFRQHAMRVQRYVFHASRQTMKLRKKGVYQIFALDWIIDDDGGIHMLEANSNPLVTLYKDMKEEFTETWDSMVDLVLKVQTAPATLFSQAHPELITEPPEKRFEYRNWHLIFSELEERQNQETFNPCEINIKPFSLKAEGKQFPSTKTTSSLPSSIPGAATTATTNVGSSVAAVTPSLRESSPVQVTTVPGPDSRMSSATSGAASVSTVSSVAHPSAPGAVVANQPQETPYQITASEVREAIQLGASRACVPMDFTSPTFEQCVRIDRGFGLDDRATRCHFGDENYFYAIEPTLKPGAKRSNCYPIVLVVAGVHGNEHAGVVAANFIRRKWTLENARLVVVERLNPKGTGKGRYIPKVPVAERDLNRNFPVSGPVGTLANQIWSVVAKLQPHIFIDLHEGWGVYNRLKANKGNGPLVGNPSFSKGSSIISTELAQPLAKYMINKVNDLTVPDATKHFLSITPPIDSGLASMIHRSFKSLNMVLETTSKGQTLHLRAQQQLVMVGACMSLLGLTPKNFDAREGFDASQACLAGTEKCILAYPGDMPYNSEDNIAKLLNQVDEAAKQEEEFKNNPVQELEDEATSEQRMQKEQDDFEDAEYGNGAEEPASSGVDGEAMAEIPDEEPGLSLEEESPENADNDELVLEEEISS